MREIKHGTIVGVVLALLVTVVYLALTGGVGATGYGPDDEVVWYVNCDGLGGASDITVQFNLPEGTPATWQVHGYDERAVVSQAGDQVTDIQWLLGDDQVARAWWIMYTIGYDTVSLDLRNDCPPPETTTTTTTEVPPSTTTTTTTATTSTTTTPTSTTVTVLPSSTTTTEPTTTTLPPDTSSPAPTTTVASSTSTPSSTTTSATPPSTSVPPTMPTVTPDTGPSERPEPAPEPEPPADTTPECRYDYLDRPYLDMNDNGKRDFYRDANNVLRWEPDALACTGIEQNPALVALIAASWSLAGLMVLFAGRKFVDWRARR